MTATLSQPDIAEVQALAGISQRRGGYTDDDADSDLSILSLWTGLHLVCLWAHDDCWGLGGDSDYAVMFDGGLFEAPPEIHSFLWDGKGTPESLKNLTAGKLIPGSVDFFSRGDHNWAVTVVDGEAD